MNIEKIRSYFPYINSGQVYLAHASTGPLSNLVLNTLKDYLYVRSETKIDDFTTFLKEYTLAKNSLGEMLNAAPDRIAFLDNTTNAINVIANGIRWNKGDRILLNDIEFPGNVYPFLNLKKLGVEVDFAKSHDGIVSAEDIINSVKPGTRMISVSQVQFLTGYRIDLEKLGAYCKEKNIIFVVDAIQGLGAIRFDVEKCNIDFIACGTQKWMLGLQGLSFIYVRKSLQEKMEQAQVGWLNVKNAWNFLNYDLNLKPSADAFENGTLNTIGIYALNASMKLFSEAGFDEIEKRVLDNSEYLITKLKEIGITPFLADQDRKYLSGIVSFRHKEEEKLFDYLIKNKVIVSLREGIIRLAPHFYNTREDIDKAISISKSGL